jgi:hypothetical protein
MTRKSFSAIPSAFGGSQDVLAEIAVFCTLCLTALVPPREQCTSAATTRFWMRERHITDETVLSLLGSGCLRSSLVLGVLLCVHMDAISKFEFSDEGLSDPVLNVSKACAYVACSWFWYYFIFAGFTLIGFSDFLKVAFRAEGPLTCKILLVPWGSNLIASGFTVLTEVCLPETRVPGKW